MRFYCTIILFLQLMSIPAFLYGKELTIEEKKYSDLKLEQEAEIARKDFLNQLRIFAKARTDFIMNKQAEKKKNENQSNQVETKNQTEIKKQSDEKNQNDLKKQGDEKSKVDAKKETEQKKQIEIKQSENKQQSDSWDKHAFWRKDHHMPVRFMIEDRASKLLAGENEFPSSMHGCSKRLRHAKYPAKAYPVKTGKFSISSSKSYILWNKATGRQAEFKHKGMHFCIVNIESDASGRLTVDAESNDGKLYYRWSVEEIQIVDEN